MPESHDEKYVRELLATRFKIDLRKLPESDVKTPDYELLVDGVRAAVLEVKRFDRTPRTPDNGWRVVERGDGIRHCERMDNAPGRVGPVIHVACEQLHAYAEPKILVFVNDESLMDVHDLEEAFNGFLNYANEDGIGYANTASAKIAHGRIREEKWLIDLYVWIDRYTPSDPMFRFATETGRELAQRFFGWPSQAPSPDAVPRSTWPTAR